jgi:hypothetical protein
MSLSSKGPCIIVCPLNKKSLEKGRKISNYLCTTAHFHDIIDLSNTKWSDNLE